MSSTTASSQSSNSPSPSPSEAYLWDVQEILAERTSVTGGNEVLVVMKSVWIPIEAIMDDTPALRRFRETSKWKFRSESGVMSIKLSVEPGSHFARDRMEDQEMVTAAAARAPATAAAMRDHTLRAFSCCCALCAMHAEHLQPPIRQQSTDNAASDAKRQNTGK